MNSTRYTVSQKVNGAEHNKRIQHLKRLKDSNFQFRECGIFIEAPTSFRLEEGDYKFRYRGQH